MSKNQIRDKISAREMRRRLDTVLQSNRLLARVVQAAQYELALIADASDPDKQGGAAKRLATVGRRMRDIYALAANWRDKPPMIFAQPQDSTVAEQAAVPVSDAAGPTLEATVNEIENEPVQPVAGKC